jgi:hypothetical protein
MAIVSVALALSMIRQDAGVEDDLVGVLLAGATESVIGYLNRDVYETQDDLDAAVTAGIATANAMVATDLIRAAALKQFYEIYTNRGNTAFSTSAELTVSVKSMLRSIRIVPGV